MSSFVGLSIVVKKYWIEKIVVILWRACTEFSYFPGARDQDSLWFMISVARHQSGIIITLHL
jgi:hypothetical protein